MTYHSLGPAWRSLAAEQRRCAEIYAGWSVKPGDKWALEAKELAYRADVHEWMAEGEEARAQGMTI